MNNESLRTNDSMPCVEELLERYASMVYRLAFARTQNRHDADDILQEVFLRYIRCAPEYMTEEHRKAWLIHTTLNCTKSLLSSAWFRRTVPLEECLQSKMQPYSEVYDAVMRLPVKYRTIIHLYYYEGYTVRKIAHLLCTKESTVKSQMHRARQKLYHMLGEEMLDVPG